MWPVKRPELDAGETFAICISRVKNAALRRRRPELQLVIGGTNRMRRPKLFDQWVGAMPSSMRSFVNACRNDDETVVDAREGLDS